MKLKEKMYPNLLKILKFEYKCQFLPTLQMSGKFVTCIFISGIKLMFFISSQLQTTTSVRSTNWNLTFIYHTCIYAISCGLLTRHVQFMYKKCLQQNLRIVATATG